MSPQKWKLLSKKDVSPSKWFPIEMRRYELPGGRIVDDFTVTTLADVAMIIPVMADGKIVMVNQYKPGLDAVMLQFPAGRLEDTHANVSETALHELEEEAGIKVSAEQLSHFTTLGGFPTKASEKVYFYLGKNCVFNSKQHLDPNEEIEVVTFTVKELDEKIEGGIIWCAQTIAGWELAKKKFPELLQ